MKNLGKKEQRLQLLEYKTKALTEKGYIKETYRDLLIFTNGANKPRQNIQRHSDKPYTLCKIQNFRKIRTG